MPVTRALQCLAGCIALKVPTSYTECANTPYYVSKSELKCTYSVPRDDSNNTQSKDFIGCHLTMPYYSHLAGYDCEFVSKRKNGEEFKTVICSKSDGKNISVGELEKDCTFIFYNADYQFPSSFEECMSKEDRTEGKTYENKQICSIEVNYSPIRSEEYNSHQAKNMMENCSKAGGRVEMITGRYPACFLSFTE